MLENLIVILLVIGLSYLFRQNSNDTFNTQMLFILLTLGGIIFYKIIYLQNYTKNNEMFIVDKEPFQNNLNNVLNNFTNGSIETNNKDTLTANKERISNLENTLNDLTSKLENLEKEQEGLGENSVTELELRNKSNIELELLENEINELTEKAIDNKKKEYKKIPVYNSCIISEANGEKTNTVPFHTHPKEDLSDEDKESIEEKAKFIKDKKDLLNQYEMLIGKMKGPISKIFEGTANIEFN